MDEMNTRQMDAIGGGEEVTAVPEMAADAAENEAAESPYFPNGVYEDGQVVEEFYGRGKPMPEYDSFQGQSADEVSKRAPLSWSRVIVLSGVGFILILVIVFLAVTGRIPWLF